MLSEISVAWLFFFYLGRNLGGVNMLASGDTIMTDGKGNSLGISGTDNMFKELDDLIPKNGKDRSKIVEPGAEYAENQLWQSAPYRTHIYKSQNYLGSKLRDPQHLRESGSVTHKPNEYVDGSTDVGFTSQSAPIARWVDQGTYRQDPQFFIEHAFEQLDPNVLFGAEENVYRRMLKEKHPDLMIE